MSQIVIKKLPLRLPRTDVDALVEFTVRAFASSGDVDDLTGGDDALRPLHFRSEIGAANVGGGEIYGAVEMATGKVVSLAVCVPPGKILNETPEEREQGMDELLSRLSSEAKDWREKIVAGQIFPFFMEALKLKSVKDGWSIHLVATDPDYQGRGLASAVIRTMLAKYKGSSDLVALSCTTEHLERFYQSLGFQTKGYKVFPSYVHPGVILTFGATFAFVYQIRKVKWKVELIGRHGNKRVILRTGFISDEHDFVDSQFSKAVSIVQSLPKTGPIQTDYEEKLVMYSLYKQATVGNVKPPRPGIWDMLGRAKWDAWAKHKNLPSQEAKLLYVETLLRVLRKYSDKTVARDLCRELESYGNLDTSFTRSMNSRYGRNSPGSSGSESAAEAVRARQRNSRLMQSEEYIPGSEEEDTTTDEDDNDNTDHERDKGEYSEDDDNENTEVQQPPRPQTTTTHSMIQQPSDPSFRPPSSLSSQTLMRYRTPMAGSMMSSITPNVPGGLGASMLSNLVPGPNGGIPTVQPMPAYTTPSAFGGDSMTFSPPIIPSSGSASLSTPSTYVPGAPYPQPYTHYTHQFPSSSTPSVQTQSSQHSKTLIGGLNLIHEQNSLPYNTIPLPSQAQYIQQYDPSVTNGVNNGGGGGGGGGGPPTIERVLQNIQAHIAALSERVEMLETITNVREMSGGGGGGGLGGNGNGVTGGNVVGRNSSLSSSSLLLPGSMHSSFLGVTSNHVWDPTQLGLWSNLIRPLSRIIDSLRSAIAFLIYVPIEETHQAQSRDPRYRSYLYSRRRYSSPSLSILLIIRRLILDVSFVFSLLGLVRFVWRQTGLKRRVVYNLFGMLWRMIMGGGGERRVKVMVDKGV